MKKWSISQQKLRMKMNGHLMSRGAALSESWKHPTFQLPEYIQKLRATSGPFGKSRAVTKGAQKQQTEAKCCKKPSILRNQTSRHEKWSCTELLKYPTYPTKWLYLPRAPSHGHGQEFENVSRQNYLQFPNNVKKPDKTGHKFSIYEQLKKQDSPLSAWFTKIQKRELSQLN